MPSLIAFDTIELPPTPAWEIYRWLIKHNLMNPTAFVRVTALLSTLTLYSGLANMLPPRSYLLYGFRFLISLILLAVVFTPNFSASIAREPEKVYSEEVWNSLEKALTAGAAINAKLYVGKRIKFTAAPCESKGRSEMWLTNKVGASNAVTIRVRKTISDVWRIERTPSFIKLIQIEGVIRSIDTQKREVLVIPTSAQLLFSA